jgi:hypothetical protein
MFEPGGPVVRSRRRRGQFLVAVGAVLGVLVGVVLGLGVENTQTSAVAAPTPAGAAAVAAAPPTSQLTVSPPAGPGHRADGDASTGRLDAQSVDRPGKAKAKAGKDGKRSRKGPDKGSGDHPTDRSGKDKHR